MQEATLLGALESSEHKWENDIRIATERKTREEEAVKMAWREGGQAAAAKVRESFRAVA